MPIELFLQHGGQEHGRLISIVSRDAFEAYWRPLAERLDLAWVAMIGTGFPVTPEDIPAILEELTRLAAALGSNLKPEIGSSVAHDMLERISHLCGELELLKGAHGVDAYLG